MSMLGLLASSNYISVNKTLIKTFGLEEAVMLGELCSEYDYWQSHDQLTEDGFFYATMDKIRDNTGLSDHQQRSAIQSLKNAGVLETKLKGVPATKHFKIDESQLCSFLISRSEKTAELDLKKLHLSNNSNNKNKKPLIAKAIKGVPEKSFSTISTIFMDKYNSICTKLPKCLKLTDKRQKAIGKIVSKYDMMSIENALTKANESSFLTGDNDRGWKADIDFILREDKFVSILEDKYSSKQKLSSKAGTDVGSHSGRIADKKKFREDIDSGKAEKF